MWVPVRIRERLSKGAECKRDLRRGGMAVRIEGGVAQNGVKERVRVGKLDDDGCGRMLEDAGDRKTSKLRCSAAQRCLQFPAGNTSLTQQLGRCQFPNTTILDLQSIAFRNFLLQAVTLLDANSKHGLNYTFRVFFPFPWTNMGRKGYGTEKQAHGSAEKDIYSVLNTSLVYWTTCLFLTNRVPTTAPIASTFT